MKIQIDQSGKIEETDRRTVIGDSLGNVATIKSSDKRIIQEVYRLSKQPRKYVLHLFSLLVALLIRKSFNQGNIYLVDQEYPGNDEEICELIQGFSQKLGIKIEQDKIRFTCVGKGSKAHGTVHKAFKLKHPIELVSNEILLKYLLPQKRTELA